MRSTSLFTVSAVCSMSHLCSAFRPQHSAIMTRMPRQSQHQRLFLALPFFEDDEDCDPYEEDDCLPNWDFGQASISESAPAASTSGVAVGIDTDDERDIDMQPRPAESLANIGATSKASVTDKRVHLEVTWQIDECKTTDDACEDFCEECAGSGRVRCHFCRGTRTLVMNGEFSVCPICDEHGTVECNACSGTGFIAPWASTIDDHLTDKTA
uniref:Uncharacterized protein n=1 Tax=Craspedostauros australis TaxID=1486917 RepID=A0A7R9WVV6_9STRA|mmetsp:Transcript_2097/g.5821  ORF Transcript_2097/g.5821 Transcript_2097/m.5821 type:complete len:212 (+) Transcript_2097:231-866(+)